MKNDNLYALFEAQLPRDLNAPWLETTGGFVYSWRDLHYASARIAGWLRRLALAPDAQGFAPRVAVQVEKSPEALILYLATLRAGWVFVPLNTAYQRAELEYFLGDAQPSVFVCTPERFADLAPLAEKAGVAVTVTLGEARNGMLLEAAAPMPDTSPTVQRSANDLAAIVYTSGTTGRSKGAMLTHGNLASNAQVLDEFWGFKEEREAGGHDVLLHVLPLFHVHGLFVAAHAALMAGAQILFMAKFDPREVIRRLPRATVFMGVPTHYTRLLAEPGFDRHACRNMRLLISGSAPLLADTHKDLYRRTGHMVVERYGMSETLMLTSNPYFGIATRDRIAGSVGVPLPGTAVRIVDGSGVPRPVGEIGDVQVRGPSVFAGYWRMPEKTAEEFTSDGYFKTGDVGHFGGPGKPDNHLTLVGRSKDLIISGGYNVYPKEVEGYIDEMPGIVESAVIGLPHPDFGEAVAAVVVHKPGAHVDGGEIIARLKGQIANYKVPKRVFVVDELPRNAMGKVQKSVLRERHRATFAAEVRHAR